MSNLSTIDPMPEAGAPDENESSSPLSMLFTMLLLIAGFLFSSVLLLQQTYNARNENGERILDAEALSAAMQSMGEHTASDSPREEMAQQQEPATSPFEGLRQIVEGSSDGSVRWPRLRLTGFGKSSDGTEDFAIINGDLVHPGESAGKVTLVEVRARDVIVEYRGERKTLTVELED